MKRLEKVKIFYKKHNRFPTYTEMLNLFNLASKNAVYKIMQLWIRKNFVKKEGSRFAPTSKFFVLPILGRVKAGFPTGSSQELQDTLSLDQYLIENPTRSFLLTVSGDSLTDLGIFEGDLAIIERSREAKSGDIVLAQIDGEWALKIFKKTGGNVFLASANPKYKPFYPESDLQIFGIVRSIVRKL